MAEWITGGCGGAGASSSVSSRGGGLRALASDRRWRGWGVCLHVGPDVLLMAGWTIWDVCSSQGRGWDDGLGSAPVAVDFSGLLQKHMGEQKRSVCLPAAGEAVERLTLAPSGSTDSSTHPVGTGTLMCFFPAHHGKSKLYYVAL